VGIEDDVVEHIIVAGAELGESRPVMAAIIGDENHSGAGAQENAVGIVRIVRQTADIAAIRPRTDHGRTPAANADMEAISNNVSNLAETDFIVIFCPTVEKVRCDS